MKYRYIAIRSDEDGNCVRFLTGEKVRKMVEDPTFSGINGFYTEEEFDAMMEPDGSPSRSLNPMTWPYGKVLLLKLDKVLEPKVVATEYTVEM